MAGTILITLDQAGGGTAAQQHLQFLGMGTPTNTQIDACRWHGTFEQQDPGNMAI